MMFGIYAHTGVSIENMYEQFSENPQMKYVFYHYQHRALKEIYFFFNLQENRRVMWWHKRRFFFVF